MGLIIKAFITLYQNSSTVRSVVTGTLNAILTAIQDVLEAIQSLVGWIGRIHFPSKPDWLPLSLPGTSAMVPAGPATMMAGGAPVVNVTIHGALDPESTAIAIRRVLSRYDRRRGRPLGLGATGALG